MFVNFSMVEKTKNKIVDSTLSLIDKKPFHQISTKEIADDGYYQVNIYSGMSNFPNSSCWHFKIASSSDNYIMGQYFTIE